MLRSVEWKEETYNSQRLPKCSNADTKPLKNRTPRLVIGSIFEYVNQRPVFGAVNPPRQHFLCSTAWILRIHWHSHFHQPPSSSSDTPLTVPSAAGIESIAVAKSMATLKEILTRRPVSATIRLTVPAGGARPAPPVGPALGQYRLNLMAFCKDFNARTQKYKPDTPMAVTITAFKDNTFEFTVKSPSVTWYLKKAAGIELGSGRPGHVIATTLSLKHIYEIAKVKQSDPYCQYMSLESICKSIIGTANTMGIKVVKDLEE
ncbi:Ribosomal protein [Trema orientale]|uniref:Large ribosomal subunit protein uL11m n=2 Tax=Cannabaceae TaxID=3481 RepID=A0A2P5DBL3_TREOI|nr:Ribosomal protein [Trema orientale]